MNRAELHFHPASLYDSENDPKKTFKECQEKGVTSIALTDHGLMTQWMPYKLVFDELNAEAKKNDEPTVKLIYGAEANTDLFESLYRITVPPASATASAASKTRAREHLVLLAKNQDGLTAIQRAVSDAALIQEDTSPAPVITREIAEKWFSKGAQGHGHVICLTACINGPLGSILLTNHKIEREADKLAVKAAMKRHTVQDVDRDKRAFAEAETAYNAAVEARQTAMELKNKRYSSALKAAEKSGDANAVAEIRAQIAESEKAAAEYPALKAAEAEARKAYAEAKKVWEKSAKIIADAEALLDEAVAKRNERRPDEELYAEATKRLNDLNGLFGKENVYCELQYHGMDEEKIVYPKVLRIATDVGNGIVATNDTHILKQEDDAKRQFLRFQRFNSVSPSDPSDKELYLKSAVELGGMLSMIVPPSVATDAVQNSLNIADLCNADLPTDKHYPVWSASDPKTEIRKLIKEGKEIRYPNGEGWTRAHRDRVLEELEVMEKLKVLDYMLTVRAIIRYAKAVAKVDREDPRFLANPFDLQNLEELGKGRVAIGVGPARGSAAGSLVCYLIGITEVDPIKYNLLFSRFLNASRVTMPDIDIDLAVNPKEACDVRGWTIRYLQHTYGEKALCQILTLGKNAAKASIRSAARYVGDAEKNDARAYYSLGSDICAVVPAELGVKLSDAEAAIRQNFGSNATAMKILEVAKIAEGTTASYGTHAAGIVLSDSSDISEYVPLMKSKGSEMLQSQYTMAGIEASNLLKFDLLGLACLTDITNILNVLAKDGQMIDPLRIPLDNKAAYDLLSAGDTDGVFQLESDGMKRLLRDFRPRTIEDLILLIALFRPGPLQFVSPILEVRNGQRKPEYILPQAEEILAPTYGYPVYQEQIMMICNKLAGFSMVDADNIRRAMSKKKMEKMASYRQSFVEGLVKGGADQNAAEKLWEQLMDFSQYAFNKAHAASYGILAYWTAYLKANHPAAFLLALLNGSEFDKTERFVKDASSKGVKVMKPDINMSTVDHTLYGPKILFGLSAVKSVGRQPAQAIATERATNGAFDSLADLRERVPSVASDALTALIYAGAFDDIANVQPAADVAERRNALLAELGAKSDKFLADRTAALIAERAYVGAFLGENPANEYVAKNECDKLVAGKTASVTVVIDEITRKTASSGEEFAIIDAEDATAAIKIVCYSKEWSVYRTILKKNAVFVVNGFAKERGEAIELILNSVAQPQRKVEQFILVLPQDAEEAKEVREMAEEYQSADGVPLFISVDGRISDAGFRVSKDITDGPVSLYLA